MKRQILAVALAVSVGTVLARAEETHKGAAAPKAAETPSTNAAPTTTPHIKFDQTVYDFGTTQQVDSVTGTFTFSNTGDGVLELKKPSPSCGCTVASVKPEILKPGEKGELVFKMNVGAARGRVEKHITLPTTDPQNPSVNLTVRAEIKPTYDVAPSPVVLGDLKQGQITNVTVSVKRIDGKKLEITKTESSSKQIRTRLEPDTSITNGTAAKLIIEAEAEGVPRRFAETVKLFAEDTNRPAVQITVHGRLLGDLTLNPEAIFWGITNPENWPGANPEAMTTRRVVVTSTRDDGSIQVTGAVSSLKDVSVDIVQVQTGKVFAVVAKLSAPPKESEHGTITIDTTATSQPKLVVPVTINVLKR